MQRLFFFVLICLTLIGCNENTPADSSLHQPENPSTWSPIGHKYVYKSGGGAPNTYAWWYGFTSIEFFSNSFLRVSHNEKEFEYIKYFYQYPDIYIFTETKNAEHGWGTFIDTLTIACSLDSISIDFIKENIDGGLVYTGPVIYKLDY